MSGKRYPISNERFCELHNKAKTLCELQKILEVELKTNVEMPFIQYRISACKKLGLSLKPMRRKNAVDVDSLNHFLKRQYYNTPAPPTPMATYQ